jgi:hypothetical protein
MDRDGSIKLLSASLADLPSLPGAACSGRHLLFDEVPGRGGSISGGSATRPR